jgi:hypothetical protein
MNERDEWADDLLARSKRYLDPRPQDAARVLEAVCEQCVQAPALSHVGSAAKRVVDDTRSGVGNARRAIAAKLIGVGAITGVCGFLLGFVVGQRTGTETGGPSLSAPGQPAAAAAVGATPGVGERPALNPAPAEWKQLVPTPPKSVPVPDTEAARLATTPSPNAAAERTSTPRKPAPSAAAAQTLSFREALELLRRAQAAQRVGRAGEAFTHLDELDRRASDQLLREERLLTAVLASCDLGELERARRLAAELERQNPSSIYNGRLRNSCVGREELGSDRER